MSNSLDPDQAKHFIRPGLGPNCLPSYQQTALAGKKLDFWKLLGDDDECDISSIFTIYCKILHASLEN